MRIVRWGAGGVLCAVMLVGSSRVATADLTSDDGCKASGSWVSSGLVVDATAKGTVTVPGKDTVQWTGSVSGPPGSYAGSMWIELPPPFGKVTIRSWKGDSQTTSNAGDEKYSLPSFVPAGAVFTVSGRHVDANGTCAGTVKLKLDGSPLSSPSTWVALGGTVVSGAGLAALIRGMFTRVGKVA